MNAQRGSYAASKPAVAPIFNCRRRQRHAIFADPYFSPSVQNDLCQQPPSSVKTDLMPVGGFQARGQQLSRSAGQEWNSRPPVKKQRESDPQQYNISSSRIRSSSATVSHSSFGRESDPTFARQGYGRLMGDTPTSANRGHNSQFSSTDQKSRESSAFFSRSNRNLQSQTSGQFNLGPTGQSPFGQSPGLQSRPAYQHQRMPSRANQGFGSGSLSMPPQTSARQPDDSPCPQSQSLEKPKARSASQKQRSASKKQSAGKDKPAESLKMLPANIRTLKKTVHMSELLGPHMFEVFGILDSAVVVEKSGTGKEFILRDETDAIQCVFYEIDRTLPRIVRGQWQRCVGKLDYRSKKFKCVSVRHASLEERRLSQMLEPLSDQLIASVAMETSEP